MNKIYRNPAAMPDRAAGNTGHVASVKLSKFLVTGVRWAAQGRVRSPLRPGQVGAKLQLWTE